MAAENMVNILETGLLIPLCPGARQRMVSPRWSKVRKNAAANLKIFLYLFVGSQNTSLDLSKKKKALAYPVDCRCLIPWLFKLSVISCYHVFSVTSILPSCLALISSRLFGSSFSWLFLSIFGSGSHRFTVLGIAPRNNSFRYWAINNFGYKRKNRIIQGSWRRRGSGKENLFVTN